MPNKIQEDYSARNDFMPFRNSRPEFELCLSISLFLNVTIVTGALAITWSSLKEPHPVLLWQRVMMIIFSFLFLSDHCSWAKHRKRTPAEICGSLCHSESSHPSWFGQIDYRRQRIIIHDSCWAERKGKKKTRLKIYRRLSRFSNWKHFHIWDKLLISFFF